MALPVGDCGFFLWVRLGYFSIFKAFKLLYLRAYSTTAFIHFDCQISFSYNLLHVKRAFCKSMVILFLQKILPITYQPQATLAKMIFGGAADKLPQILQKRYANRPHSKDSLLLQGEMNIFISQTFRLLSPLFRLAGSLVPYPANNIPVQVKLMSDEKSNAILMQRTFYYQNKMPYHFSSRMMHIRDNIAIEFMRFGFASRLIYRMEENKIIMDYGGYVFRLGKWLLPLPLGFLIGKFYAFEVAESDESFAMQVKMVHPLFGKIFQYDGKFKISARHD